MDAQKAGGADEGPRMAKTIKKKKSVASAKYTGELAKPLIGFFGADEQAAHQYYSYQRRAKLKALFEWYSIDPADPDAWARLAIDLALNHVPGMTVRPASKKRGRVRSWDDLYAKLLRAVEDVREEKRMTIREAIKVLRKGSDWRSFTQESLEIRYREARNIEQDHRRLYREWKENPSGLPIALLKAFAVNLDEHYFEQLRSGGFKIDEI
jgi:hypothetical protein